jgi:SAM-dependent methyltransferase
LPDLEFRRDLYQGTARHYDRFRIPYPQALIDDLLERSGANGLGWLLDLACGTGQISFALHGRFAEVWAADQEPDMTAVVREKAGAAGIGNIRVLTSAAEDLSAPEESFDLVAIGNAFHRLPREAVAAKVFRLLRPGGFLALLWSRGPWDGEAPWQRAMSATLDQWRARADAHGRIPAGYQQDRKERPDMSILREAGMEVLGFHEFPTAHEWTADALIGFVFSTSFLSRAALGELAPSFESELRREFAGGPWQQTIDFAYELARRPPQVHSAQR